MRWTGLIVLGLAACSQAPESPPEAPGPMRYELASADPVEHGERLAQVLGCTGCHAADMTGNDWSDPEYGTLWTANLTRSAAKYSHDELVTMVTEGRRPDRALLDMPAYLFNALHPDDVDAVVRYLETVEPIGEVRPEPTIGPKLQAEKDSGEWTDSPGRVARHRDEGPPDLGPQHALARMIVRSTCSECHGIDLTGGKEPMEEGGNAPPDLRIVGSYSREDFAHFFATGEAAGGRELPLMSRMALRRYSYLTDAEEDAVYDYLADWAQRSP